LDQLRENESYDQAKSSLVDFVGEARSKEVIVVITLQKPCVEEICKVNPKVERKVKA
jgi:hypothetical protein